LTDIFPDQMQQTPLRTSSLPLPEHTFDWNENDALTVFAEDTHRDVAHYLRDCIKLTNPSTIAAVSALIQPIKDTITPLDWTAILPVNTPITSYATAICMFISGVSRRSIQSTGLKHPCLAQLAQLVASLKVEN
jgi:hypothetical protein